MSLEANRFLGRLTGEAVEDQNRQQIELINKIKAQGQHDLDRMPTKELDDISYQKFRRTLGLIIKQINVASERLQDFLANPGDDEKEYNALTDISNIVSVWNEMTVSLSLLGYNNLRPVDKQKINDDINKLRPYLERLRTRLDPNDLNFANFTDIELLRNIHRSIVDMIEELDSKIFKPISVPVGAIP